MSQAREEVTVTRWECGCGRVAMTEEHQDPPDGLHGSVWAIGHWGGSGSAEWWAHAERCITKSIKAALASLDERNL